MQQEETYTNKQLYNYKYTYSRKHIHHITRHLQIIFKISSHQKKKTTKKSCKHKYKTDQVQKTKPKKKKKPIQVGT